MQPKTNASQLRLKVIDKIEDSVVPENRKKKKPARSKVQNANRQANFKAVPKQ